MSRCKNHPISMDGFIGADSCQECSQIVYSGILLCERCSKYSDRCELCGEAAESDINPVIVVAFNSPEAVRLRQLRKTAIGLQKGAYRDSLSKIYNDLIAPAREILTAALKPLQEQASANELADPVVAAALAELEAARALPYAENRDRNRDAMNAASAASRPHRDTYTAASQAPLAEYNKAIAPYESVHKALWEALLSSTTAIIDDCDDGLEKLIVAARQASRVQ